MRHKPYIGVTGFMSRMDIETVLSALPEDSRHRLMAGVLMSNTTLWDEGNRHPGLYPKPLGTGAIFLPGNRTLNLIHFNTKKVDQLYEDMIFAGDMAGRNCHGFQLNVPWPNIKVLRRYKNAPTESKVIVLQCGEIAILSAHSEPAEIAERLKAYEDLIDYVLLDTSSGEGRQLDVEFTLRCFGEIAKAVPDLNFGVAGGLSSMTVGTLLHPILREFPLFSIDAQKGVQWDEHEQLNATHACEYVTIASDIFAQYASTKNPALA